MKFQEFFQTFFLTLIFKFCLAANTSMKRKDKGVDPITFRQEIVVSASCITETKTGEEFECRAIPFSAYYQRSGWTPSIKTLFCLMDVETPQDEMLCKVICPTLYNFRSIVYKILLANNKTSNAADEKVKVVFFHEQTFHDLISPSEHLPEVFGNIEPDNNYGCWREETEPYHYIKCKVEKASGERNVRLAQFDYFSCAGQGGHNNQEYEKLSSLCEGKLQLRTVNFVREEIEVSQNSILVSSGSTNVACEANLKPFHPEQKEATETGIRTIYCLQENNQKNPECLHCRVLCNFRYTWLQRDLKISLSKQNSDKKVKACEENPYGPPNVNVQCSGISNGNYDYKDCKISCPRGYQLNNEVNEYMRCKKGFWRNKDGHLFESDEVYRGYMFVCEKLHCLHKIEGTVIKLVQQRCSRDANYKSTTCHYECQNPSYYVLRGDKSVTWDKDCKTDQKFPECEERLCEYPDPDLNEMVSCKKGEEINDAFECEHKCDPGYEGMGNNLSTCKITKNGKVEKKLSKQKCYKICEKPEPPKNGKSECVSIEKEKGFSCTYTCNEGYTMSGNNNTVRCTLKKGIENRVPACWPSNTKLYDWDVDKVYNEQPEYQYDKLHGLPFCSGLYYELINNTGEVNYYAECIKGRRGRPKVSKCTLEKAVYKEYEKYYYSHKVCLEKQNKDNLDKYYMFGPVVEDFKCGSSTRRRPHPKNCLAFIQCKGGKATLMICHKGFVYDISKQKCVIGQRSSYDQHICFTASDE